MIMVTHAVLMSDPNNPTAPPVPAHQYGYNLEDVTERVQQATTNPGNVWFGWCAVVDPFPMDPTN